MVWASSCIGSRWIFGDLGSTTTMITTAPPPPPPPTTTTTTTTPPPPPPLRQFYQYSHSCYNKVTGCRLKVSEPKVVDPFLSSLGMLSLLPPRRRVLFLLLLLRAYYYCDHYPRLLMLLRLLPLCWYHLFPLTAVPSTVRADLDLGTIYTLKPEGSF